MGTKSEASEISEAKELLKKLLELKKPSVGRFEDSGEKIRPKVVWKYDSFIQAILYRVTDIAEDAIGMWRNEKSNSSIILARSLMETAAAAYWLITRVSKKITAGDLAGADEDVSDLSFASRTTDGFPRGKSVITFIDEVDKLIPGFRDVYNIMSEASHPNYMGTLRAYSDMDETYQVTYFDKHPDTVEFLNSNMPAAFSGSLIIMEVAVSNYNNIRLALAELGQHELEKQSRNKYKTPRSSN